MEGDFEFIGLDTASSRVHSVHQRTKLKAKKKKFEVIGTWEFYAGEDNADIRRGELYRSCCEYFAVLELISPGCQVFCEEPLALRNGKTTRVLCLAVGAIWTAHLEFNLMWHWVDVAHWKKQICGSGSASKTKVQEWSRKNGGLKKWDEDHHDANAIGVSGATDLIALDA